MEDVTPIYKCKHCRKVYKIYSSYYCHVKRHGPPREFSCPKKCSFKTHTRARLLTHFYKCKYSEKLTVIEEDEPLPAMNILAEVVVPASQQNKLQNYTFDFE